MGIFVAVALVALLAMAGMAIDVGSWYRQQRAEQATADAAALAGAQALPDDPSTAIARALEYSAGNGGGLVAGDITITSQRAPNDTISVRVKRDAPTYFTRIFGFESLTIHARAGARSDGISSARYVAPIAVSSEHPMLQCTPRPCTGTTDLDLIRLKGDGSSDAAGNFSLLDLRGRDRGSVGESTLAVWMTDGFTEEMPLGIYTGVPSAKFNSSSFRQSVGGMIGSEVLFPVYQPPIEQSGSNAEFTIIGWVGFVIDSATGGGNSARLHGHFVRFIAQGMQAMDPNGNPDFGVRAIQLVQ